MGIINKHWYWQMVYGFKAHQRKATNVSTHLMKTISYILTLLISTALYGQSEHFSFDSLSRTSRFYDDSGRITCKIEQLDKEIGKHEHFISYAKNGQKTEEFFSKNRVVYDTLKKWTDKGELHLIEIYTDTGYTSIDYWHETGRILEIGTYTISKESPKNITVYDSTTFDKFITAECKTPCYVRTGIWKTFYENGILEGEGEYLPMAFNVSYPTKDSSGIAVPIKNTDFEMKPDTMYIICLTYLKNGKWIYYNEKGIKIKEEYYSNGLRQK